MKKKQKKHAEKKRSPGRPRGAEPLLKEITGNEDWRDIRCRLIYGTADWQIVRLRELIGDGSKWADNNLSARLTATKLSHGLLNKIEAIQREHLSEEDQALLKHLRSRDEVRKLTNREKEALRKENEARLLMVKAKAKASAKTPRVTLQDLNQLWNKLFAKRNGQPPTLEEWLTERDKLYVEKTGKPYRPEPSDEIAWLWRTVQAQFEHAVINGDYKWLERQAKAMRRDSYPYVEHSRLREKVVQLAELAFWYTHRASVDPVRTKQEPKQSYVKKRKSWATGEEQDRRQHQHAAKAKRKQRKLQAHVKATSDATLSPQDEFTDPKTGKLVKISKFADVKTRDIYNALNKEWKKGCLVIEGCSFESKDDKLESAKEQAMEEIRMVLKDLLHLSWNKQKRPSKDVSGD